jgi:adenosylmethionine-8-amino-7-oxononanoate aminotransferase
MPPLVISASELDEMFALTRAALDATAKALLVAR